MPLRSDWSAKSCPIARSLDVLGDPWTVLVLRELFTGNLRFDSIRDRLEVADTVLSKRLNALTDAGLVNPTKYGGGTARARYEYRLTNAGQATLPVLHALAQWGAKHRSDGELSRSTLEISCVRCGREANSADWCTECNLPLSAESTEWRRPADPSVALRLMRS
ncbi:winged helix-turn-helix transcriptional regulator [Rhodococcus sp. NPDC057529]|uniref:winged helix-turn-helix transcriptional regulator n=1 Tax=Rhodococcus sp. NPDC057529 TaxID=3346158 RepID=UPI0036718847